MTKFERVISSVNFSHVFFLADLNCQAIIQADIYILYIYWYIYILYCNGCPSAGDGATLSNTEQNSPQNDTFKPAIVIFENRHVTTCVSMRIVHATHVKMHVIIRVCGSVAVIQRLVLFCGFT